MTFSSSLDTLVATPARYGWPYDAAVVIGFGYGGPQREAMAATLDRPEVEAWGLASLGASDGDGQAVPAIAAGDGFDRLAVPVLKGSWPTGDDEIALGARTAERLGLAVDDETLVTTDYGSRRATVSALVVLPALGPFLSDRVSLGTGVLLSGAFLDAMVGPVEQEAGLAPGDLGDELDSFVAIDLRDDVDPAAFLDDIAEQLPGWDASGWEPFVFPDAVRPPQIADVAAMRSAPTVLAGLLAATMATALGLAISFATRSRRRELALARALGCDGSQLRATVRWHSLMVVGAGLAVGTPLGLAIGAWTWRAFAGGLGRAHPHPAPALDMRHRRRRSDRGRRGGHAVGPLRRPTHPGARVPRPVTAEAETTGIIVAWVHRFCDRVRPTSQWEINAGSSTLRRPRTPPGGQGHDRRRPDGRLAGP